jgi:hypothetical protein
MGRWTFCRSPAPYGLGGRYTHQCSDVAARRTHAPTIPGGAAVNLICVLEEIRTLQKRLEVAKVWEARVKELKEVLQVQKGTESSEGGDSTHS